MDKKYKQKVKEFFRKEGFYVVLFLCLCLVATVTAISYKVSNQDKVQTEAAKSSDNSEISANSQEKDKVTSEIPNAERVAKDKAEEKVTVTDGENTTEATKSVSASVDVKFIKPIEGSLLRGYTYPKPVRVDDKNQRTIRGIDIEAKVGTEVKAAAEGVVESVGNNGVEEGMTVVIIHANGIKTKYTNLDSEVSIKKDDKVTSNTVIGKVGLTAKIFNKEDFGEHLNLQVLSNENEQMDPLKYFEYKSE